MNTLLLISSLIPFYLLGAFPSGLVIARRAGIDITKAGSGNVGATNVGRILGVRAGVITLLLDVGKGALAVTIAAALGTSLTFQALVAVVVVLGHCFSIPPRKGGKGVATALGVTASISLPLGACAVIFFAAAFAFTRTVSVGSMSAALLTPIAASILGSPDQHLYALFVVGLLIVVRHHANINRLIRGEEPKTLLGSKKGTERTGANTSNA